MKPAASKASRTNTRLSEPADRFSAELLAARSRYLKAEVRFEHAVDVVCQSHPGSWGLVLARAVVCRNRAFDSYRGKLERFAAIPPLNSAHSGGDDAADCPARRR